MSQRLSIFAKGNADTRDPLHMQALGGKVLWNGLNQVLRDQGRDCTIRVRHETHTTFSALLAANGSVPAELAEGLDSVGQQFGPFPLRSQFSAATFAPGVDAVVLSIQGDIAVPMVRHRTQGHQLHPYGWQHWPAAANAWLRANFEWLPPVDPAQSMADLANVVARLRATSDAPILVFNTVQVMPGETIHCYQGLGEVLSQRMRRFNTALADASAELGFSIVDVDRIVAEHGARQLKVDLLHLNTQGCQLVAEEVVRILDDYGLLPERSA